VRVCLCGFCLCGFCECVLVGAYKAIKEVRVLVSPCLYDGGVSVCASKGARRRSLSLMCGVCKCVFVVSVSVSWCVHIKQLRRCESLMPLCVRIVCMFVKGRRSV
jgi:hypothetical protein